MTLLGGRKCDGHLCQEHEKILKDILLQCMEGQTENIKEDTKCLKGDTQHKSGFATKLDKGAEKTHTKVRKTYKKMQRI